MYTYDFGVVNSVQMTRENPTTGARVVIFLHHYAPTGTKGYYVWVWTRSTDSMHQCASVKEAWALAKTFCQLLEMGV